VGDWIAGPGGIYVGIGLAPMILGLLGMLAWMTFRREGGLASAKVTSAEQVLADAARITNLYRRIGVALQAGDGDGALLAEAVTLAKAHKSELVLMHIVEGAGGQWYGPQTGDMESRQDEQYLQDLAQRLRETLGDQVAGVRAVLGYGDVPKQLVHLTRQHELDLLIVGSHGHKGIGDIIHGSTIPAVRHGVKIPVFAVRG